MSWSSYQTFQTLAQVNRVRDREDTGDGNAMCGLLIEDGKKVYVLMAQRNNHCTVLRVCTFINLNMKSSFHHYNRRISISERECMYAMQQLTRK